MQVFLYNGDFISLIFCREACMCSSSLITMQPVACVFSSWLSSRPSASHGSMVSCSIMLYFLIKTLREWERFYTYWHIVEFHLWVKRRNTDWNVIILFYQVQTAFMITLKTWLATDQDLTSSTVGCSSPQPHALWVSTNKWQQMRPLLFSSTFS